MKLEGPFLIPNGPRQFPTAPEVVIEPASWMETKSEPSMYVEPQYRYSFKTPIVGTHTKERIVPRKEYSNGRDPVVELPGAGFVATIPGNMNTLGAEWIEMLPESARSHFEEDGSIQVSYKHTIGNSHKKEGAIELEPWYRDYSKRDVTNPGSIKIHPTILDVIGRTFTHEAATNKNFLNLSYITEVRLHTPASWRKEASIRAHFDGESASMYMFSSLLPTEQFTGSARIYDIEGAGFITNTPNGKSFSSMFDTAIRSSLMPGNLYHMSSRDWLHAVPESISNRHMLKKLSGRINNNTPRVFIRTCFFKA